MMQVVMSRPEYWVPPERSDAVTAQLALIPDGTTVLEIGTASGHVSRALRAKNCEITGIELDAAAASVAAAYCRRMIVGNIEELDLDQVLPETFDVVLCGDVLEHLKNAQKPLLALRRRLRADGYLVVSLPNVAHISVRLSLLDGAFCYAHEGLLDATHLKFFTLESIAALFNECSFEIRDLHRCRKTLFEEGPYVNPSRVPSAIVRRLTRDPEASAYQYVFRAVPSARPNRLSDLEDRHFNKNEERRQLSGRCLEAAWQAFHAEPRQSHVAGAYARLAFVTTPSVKAGVYWLASWMPKSLLRRFTRKTLEGRLSAD
jgi:2-polyprenyl-3-methyl-5-hydroxy-6-metoxy-1,4-benzoquinol methylase